VRDDFTSWAHAVADAVRERVPEARASRRGAKNSSPPAVILRYQDRSATLIEDRGVRRVSFAYVDGRTAPTIFAREGSTVPVIAKSIAAFIDDAHSRPDR